MATERTTKIPGARSRINFVGAIGAGWIYLMALIGRVSIFTFKSVSHCFRPPWYPSQIAAQILRIGYFSLPVVALTTVFTGGALALQIYLGGDRFGAEGFVPNIVALGITRELGPVLAGLMVAGRVSAAIAAELGTMRVTEQIDALSTLSTNPFKYLIAPRIIAAVLTLPFLVLVGDVIGIMGGYLAGVYSLGFNPTVYIVNTVEFITVGDVTSGLWKSTVFGFIVAVMGCYNGFYSKGGALGVGTATTNAVVWSSVLILTANFILTSLLFS